jgi:hypothetical protein
MSELSKKDEKRIRAMIRTIRKQSEKTRAPYPQHPLTGRKYPLPEDRAEDLWPDDDGA